MDFVHNGVAGKEALEISQIGGRIVQLPEYADSLNVEKTHTAQIKLSADGSAKISAKKEFKVKIYDHNSYFTSITPAKQTDAIRSDISPPNAAMGLLKITEDKTGSSINRSGL